MYHATPTYIAPVAYRTAPPATPTYATHAYAGAPPMACTNFATPQPAAFPFIAASALPTLARARPHPQTLRRTMKFEGSDNTIELSLGKVIDYVVDTVAALMGDPQALVEDLAVLVEQVKATLQTQKGSDVFEGCFTLPDLFTLVDIRLKFMHTEGSLNMLSSLVGTSWHTVTISGTVCRITVADHAEFLKLQRTGIKATEHLLDFVGENNEDFDQLPDGPLGQLSREQETRGIAKLVGDFAAAYLDPLMCQPRIASCASLEDFPIVLGIHFQEEAPPAPVCVHPSSPVQAHIPDKLPDGEDSYILMLGNPGVGKSFILNSLLGRPEFKAGVSVGTGLTDCLQIVEVAPNKFFGDCPGLDDYIKRESAAKEIECALKKNGIYKIFFIVTVEAGRIRSVDLHTMNVILKAAPSIKDYGLLINKVTKKVKFEFETEAGQIRLKEQWASLSTPPSRIEIMIRDNELDDMPNVVKTLPVNVLCLIDHTPPVKILEHEVQELDVSGWQAHVDELQRQYNERLEMQQNEAKAEREEVIAKAKAEQATLEKRYLEKLQTLAEGNHEERERLKAQYEKDQVAKEAEIQSLKDETNDAQSQAIHAREEVRKAKLGQQLYLEKWNAVQHASKFRANIQEWLNPGAQNDYNFEVVPFAPGYMAQITLTSGQNLHWQLFWLGGECIKAESPIQGTQSVQIHVCWPGQLVLRVRNSGPDTWFASASRFRFQLIVPGA